MASRPINVVIKGDYNDKDVNRAIKDLQSLKVQGETTGSGMQQSLGKIGESWKSMALGLGAGFAAFAGAEKVTEFLKSSADAALEDQRNFAVLAKAMDNVGTGGQAAQMNEWLGKLAEADGVAKDQLYPSLQKLITATGDVATSQRSLTDALDISAITGKNVVDVSAAIAKGYTGNYTALQRLNIGIDKTTIATHDMSQIMGEAETKMGGGAAAAAATYEGQLARVAAAAHEGQVTIGTSLLGAINRVTQDLGGPDGAISEIDSMSKSISDSVQNIGVLVDMFVQLKNQINNLPQLPSWMTLSISDGGSWLGKLAGSLTGGGSAFGSVVDQITGAMHQKAQSDAAIAAIAQNQQDVLHAHMGTNAAGRFVHANQDSALQGLVPKFPVIKQPKGGGSPKALADSISASMQTALDQASLQVQSYVNSDASGFGEVGVNTMNAVIKGISLGGKSKKTGDAIRQQLTDAMSHVSDVISQARDYGKSISDALMGNLDIGQAATDWQTRQDAVTSALADLNKGRADLASQQAEFNKTIADGATDSERASAQRALDQANQNVSDLQKVYQTASEVAAKGGATIVDAFVNQADKARAFASKMQTLLAAGLNQTTWDQIANLSTEQGTKVADAFIDGNMAQNVARANDAVGSVKTIAQQLGDEAMHTFKDAGIRAAISMMQAIVSLLTAGSTAKQINAAIKKLSSSLDNVQVGVSVGGSAQATSDSGISAPSIPDQSAYLDSFLAITQPWTQNQTQAQSSTYQITINGPAGSDPRQYGQQIVEAVRTFEQANGNVWS